MNRPLSEGIKGDKVGQGDKKAEVNPSNDPKHGQI